MFQVEVKERGPVISVISSNISAATALSAISLTLTSIIGAGLRMFSQAAMYMTARYFVPANFLKGMPNSDIPVSCVVKDVTRGSNFWLIDLRSLSFPTNFMLWIFGPIPMFLCSVIAVWVLMNLDRNTTPLHQYKQ
ncbi:UNVERIFIED_CONTAM: hypothetical protein Sradi_2286200 [Sesamum radiatum]|uniref:Uncharacterized protein n=1 Tax=Sesamum radiatum TaxID=300843 RepID=A0AAW2T3U8_SESRA